MIDVQVILQILILKKRDFVSPHETSINKLSYESH